VCATTGVNHAADDQQERIKSAVDKAVRWAMEKYSIPGMAVGLIVGGNPYVLNHGVASKETRKPVTHDTLFELGSISKTFTATLAGKPQ
jgi:beta-lactamase class C